MERTERARIAVVGGGLAGLGAAWGLQRAGHEVVLLERADTVGGRNSGERIEGFSIDRCVQVLSSEDRNLLSWIGELGLEERMLPLRRVQLGQIYKGRPLAIHPQTVRGVGAIRGVKRREALRVVRLARLMHRYAPWLDPEVPERAAKWDWRSVSDFARLYFGRSILDRWIGPMATSATLGDAADLSRVVFLLHWSASRQGAAWPALARAGLHEVASAAAQALPVRARLEARAVEMRGSGGELRVHCRGTGGDETIEADAVVVATAAHEAARLAGEALTGAERAFFGAVEYGPEITLSLALDRPLSGVPLHVRVPHVEGSPVETHLIEPGLAGGRAPTGCGLATVSATRRFARSEAGAADEVVTKTLWAEMERFYPRLDGNVVFTRLRRRAKSIPCFDVGAYRALERFANVQRDRRALGRRLYFAGDYLMGPTAENALVSGLRAARAVGEDFDG